MARRPARRRHAGAGVLLEPHRRLRRVPLPYARPLGRPAVALRAAAAAGLRRPQYPDAVAVPAVAAAQDAARQARLAVRKAAQDRVGRHHDISCLGFFAMTIAIGGYFYWNILAFVGIL